MTNERDNDTLEITLHANPMHPLQESEQIRRAKIIALLEQWGTEEEPVDDEEEDTLLAEIFTRPRPAPGVLSPSQLSHSPKEAAFLSGVPMSRDLPTAFRQYLRALISPLLPPPPPPAPCLSCERSRQQIAILAEQLARTRVEKQAAYHDRNVTLSLVARLACAIGLPVGLSRDVDGEEGWQVCLFLALPSGQVSWHLPDEALSFFDDVPLYEGVVSHDHTTAQQWERVLHPHLSYPASGGGGGDTSATTVKRTRAVKKKEQEKAV